MDTLDVLGARPERRKAFTRELLAETDDAELQRIVHQAAEELDAPIALVSLVLDHIQFFKAHTGLPPELAAARGTERDVSFCQYVVRDAEPFEVNDAPDDARVPQHLVKEYDIRAYLGVPIRAGDVVVGSLCVLDTKARSFSDEEREKLGALAALVDLRLRALTERRRQTRLDLSEKAAGPALAELRDSLEPVSDAVEAVLPALAAIRSFLRLAAHASRGGSVATDVLEHSLQAADRAAADSEDALYDIAVAAADCDDGLAALQHLALPAPETRLSDVLVAAQDLARPVTRAVGDAPLPELSDDPVLYTPRPLAVALVTLALTAVAQRMAEAGAAGGIRMVLREEEGHAALSVGAGELPAETWNAVASELAAQVEGDPTVRVRSGNGALEVGFVVAAEEA